MEEPLNPTVVQLFETDTRSTVLKSPKRWFKSWSAASDSCGDSQTSTCLACTGEFVPKRLVEVTCPAKHKYCSSCFEQLVKCGCENESSFPPKCCGVAIPRNLVRSYASRQTRKAWDVLDKIAHISPGDRWYCPNPKCCKVIDIQSNSVMTSKGLRCPSCRNYICVLCRQKAHTLVLECKDDALRQTLETSTRQGWRSCFRCNEMVELKEGCRHITCRCGGEFCYMCGYKWGSCPDSLRCVEKLEASRRQAVSAQGTGTAEETNAVVEVQRTRPDLQDGGLTEQQALNEAIRQSRLVPIRKPQDDRESPAFNRAIARSIRSAEAERRNNEQRVRDEIAEALAASRIIHMYEAGRLGRVTPQDWYT